MSSHINAALVTGRDIRAIEQQLAAMQAGDPRRAQLGADHTRLMRRQQDQLVAAHRAGADWHTIEFALALHGQHADREPASTKPTPAEQLSALICEHGAEQVLAVLAALDAARSRS